MNKKAIIFIVVLIVILYVFYGKSSIENFKKIKSDLDNESYMVHAEFNNSKKTAEIMASINAGVIVLLKYLIKLGEDKKPEVKRLLKRYNWQKMVENSPNNIESSTSYMERKGEVFAICLRSKNGSQNHHDFNTLFFVTCHELAHLMTPVFDDHNDEFWTYFKYLLKKASEIKLYRPVDYSKNKVEYCGMDINFNPLYSNL